MDRFDKTVSALAATIICARCSHNYSANEAAHDSVVRFLIGTHARMPDYFRLPFKVLTLMFDLWPLPTSGKPFHRLPQEARWCQIQAWQSSAIGFRRDLIKFYETLTIFGWYAEVCGQDYDHVKAA